MIAFVIGRNRRGELCVRPYSFVKNTKYNLGL